MKLIDGILVEDGKVFRKTTGGCFSLINGVDPKEIQLSLLRDGKYALVLKDGGFLWLFHGHVKAHTDGMLDVFEHRITLPDMVGRKGVELTIRHNGLIMLTTPWETLAVQGYRCLVKDNMVSLLSNQDGSLSLRWHKGQQKIDLNDPEIKDLILCHSASCDTDRLEITAVKTKVENGRIYVGIIYKRFAEPNHGNYAAVLLEYSWDGYAEGGETLAVKVRNPIKQLCSDLLSICYIDHIADDAIMLTNPTVPPTCFKVEFCCLTGL